MSVRSVTRCKKTKLSCLLFEMGSKESTTVNGIKKALGRFRQMDSISLYYFTRGTQQPKARDTSQHPTTQVEQLSNKRHISVQEM